jgi:hypothetical protein
VEIKGPASPPSGRPPTDWSARAAAWREVARGTVRGAVRAGNTTRRTVRRATNAQGAGESGLAKLTELSGVNAAGGAAVAIALAGTLFFSAPVGQARGRVALYLLITMVPFALLSPLIGPLLDRFRSGRRYAMAITFGARAFLAWEMVGSVGDAGLSLYPAVFGVLIGSRAFGVTQSAGVPRLLPPTVPLVRANSWMNMAGLLASSVTVGVGAVVTHVAGPQWTLRAAALIFVFGTVLSLRLPKRIDSAVDERPASMSETGPIGLGSRGGPPREGYVGPSVELALLANMAFRGLSGFLTLFLAFLLRQNPIGGLADTAAIGLVVGAAGIGSVLGTGAGALTKQRAPELMLVVLLMVQTVAVLGTTVAWGLTTVLGAGLVTGFAQTLGKLALDALIQRDVAEDVRSSAFARSETRLQLAWVCGGGLGIALPLRGDVGFGIASGAMVVFTVLVIGRARENQRILRRGRRPATPPGADPPGRVRAEMPMPPTHATRSEFESAVPDWAYSREAKVPPPTPTQEDGTFEDAGRPPGQVPFPPVAAHRPDQYDPPFPPAF